MTTFFDNDSAPLTVVEGKRVLTNYTVPHQSANNPDVGEEADVLGLVLAETQGWLKVVQYYGCRKRGIT